MQTECVRCHKAIDTVQGYKFSPTEYVCMSCYDEFKAERAAKAKKQQKNPLLDQYGAEPAPAAQTPGPKPAQSPPQPAQQPPPSPPQPAAPSAPPPSQPAPRGAPQPQMFAPKAPPGTPPPQAAAPKAPPKAEICDVCQKPIPDFKVPLKGGKKVCMGCNEILRNVAKSIVLNVQCPHCGKDIQLSQE